MNIRTKLQKRKQAQLPTKVLRLKTERELKALKEDRAVAQEALRKNQALEQNIIDDLNDARTKLSHAASMEHNAANMYAAAERELKSKNNWHPYLATTIEGDRRTHEITEALHHRFAPMGLEWDDYSKDAYLKIHYANIRTGRTEKYVHAISCHTLLNNEYIEDIVEDMGKDIAHQILFEVRKKHGRR